MLHHPFFLFSPVTVFGGIAFVMALLTFGQGDFGFYVRTFPVKGSTYTGIAFGLNLLFNPLQFPFVQQQFAGTARFGNQMGRSLGERRN